MSSVTTGTSRRPVTRPKSVAVVRWGLRIQGWTALAGGLVGVVLLGVTESRDPSSAWGDAASYLQGVALAVAVLGAATLGLAHLVGRGIRLGLILTILGEAFVALGALVVASVVRPELLEPPFSWEVWAAVAVMAVNGAVLLAAVAPATWRWAQDMRESRHVETPSRTSDGERTTRTEARAG